MKKFPDCQKTFVNQLIMKKIRCHYAHWNSFESDKEDQCSIVRSLKKNILYIKYIEANGMWHFTQPASSRRISDLIIFCLFATEATLMSALACSEKKKHEFSHFNHHKKSCLKTEVYVTIFLARNIFLIWPNCFVM